MANIVHWGIRDGYKLARIVGKELNDPTSYTTEEFIFAAERAQKKHPSEWVIYYSLADKYQEVGYYSEALRATQKCVELKPKDIRSTYALATSYNILTRASWTKDEDRVAEVLEELVDGLDLFDSKFSQAGLDHVGIAVETAAVQAIRWFERSLELNPDSNSQMQINHDLAALYKRFPHLHR